ncbi:MAG TPA: adenylate kinase [Actinopolymorphaceae bacterium]
MTEDDPLAGARRILVYGVTGSGKSTMAATIGQATSLPYHAVDDLMWEADWTPVAVDEQRRRITAICAEPEWVLDSAYGKWRDVVLARVELIVALDYPRWLSMWRLIRRTFHRVVTREPVCNGNRESLRSALSRRSIIWWHVKSFRPKRERMRAWERAADGPRVVRFGSPRQAREWLDRLSRPRPPRE